MTFSNDRIREPLVKIVASSKNSTIFNRLNLATLYQVDVQAIRNQKESGSVQAFYHTPIPPPENFRVDKENLTAIRVKAAFQHFQIFCDYISLKTRKSGITQDRNLKIKLMVTV